MGLDTLDPSFATRLRAAFDNAHSTGLWAGTYAMTNEREYWAEGSQSWFDTNRSNDDEHGPIDTRDELRTYDAPLAALLAEVYGDRPWRYVRPDRRGAPEHLAGFDRASAPGFSWPEDRAPPMRVLGSADAIDPANAPAASPESTEAAFIVFTNRRANPVTIEWRDFAGAHLAIGTLARDESLTQNTYVGHVWIVRENGAAVAAYVTPAGAARIEIR
jgi:hypothetical protein